MGFTFVDRITALNSERASGQLCRPAGALPLPPWLIIEAIGQLAAWIAIARSDFAIRPVAALISEVRYTGAPAIGSLELTASVGRWDGRAALYSGTARTADTEIATVVRGVGPLLPMDAFDDPDAVRRRLEGLRHGPAPAALQDSDIPRAVISAVERRGHSSRAQLQVPESAPFFAEHFPRRAVYPASLLADAQNQLSTPLAADILGAAPVELTPARVADFKVRAFSAPGQLLALAAEVRSRSETEVAIAVSAHAEGKRISSGILEYRYVRQRSA